MGTSVVPRLHLRLTRPMGDTPARLPCRLPKVSAREAASGKTIYPDELAQADDPVWRLSILADHWTLPDGAFGDHAGPP
jgi:hypothetical protein